MHSSLSSCSHQHGSFLRLSLYSRCGSYPHLFYRCWYSVWLSLSGTCRPRPSPPAPGGWDKGLTAHTQVSYTTVPEVSRSTTLVFLLGIVGIVNLILTRWYLSRHSSCPSPPAPEGWDKDPLPSSPSTPSPLHTDHVNLEYIG